MDWNWARRSVSLTLSSRSRSGNDQSAATAKPASVPNGGPTSPSQDVSATLAAETLIPALKIDRLEAEDLSEYQRRWRRRLGPEFQAQLALRMLAQRLTDPEIDSLFDLARTNGVMPLVRRTAKFNQHRHLIAELFRHAPARRLLFRRLVTA